MFSKILRRIHLYLALFLAPWVLMYTISTFVMNHRAWFRGHNAPPPSFVKERQLHYDGTFPANATPRQIGRQLLQSLNMEGDFLATERPKDSTIVVNRLDAIRPARLTFEPGTGQLTVERQVFEGAAFLERMHRRRGYQHGFVADNLWAVSVDIFIVAVLFWAASGLWLWWEMKLTRGMGAALLATGCALFAFFLAVL
ncbi:MAG: PepSY-associated TM helix domain-containing protein [Bryobacterales bacterium]|nr:PepSY-associated TM helix domain-containing protein [Bryobacterales bacterium]